MDNLEIGWIAGSNRAQDRPLQFVRSAVQEALGDRRLVSVPGGVLRPEQPVILDVTADGADLQMAIDLLVVRRICVPFLIIRRSGWVEPNQNLVEDMNVHVYRDAINVRPMVKNFVMQLDAAIKPSDFSES